MYKTNMNNICLFCSQQSSIACCVNCRKRDRSSMFEALLTIFNKASTTINYYDNLKTICQRIKTSVEFEPITQFNSAIHKVDQIAKTYLQQASAHFRNMIPIDVLGDGNCLYNSIICLSGRTHLTPSELRVRTLIEIVTNETSYGNRLANLVGPVRDAMKHVARNFSFSEIYEIAALSNVLKCNIRSVYPKLDYRSELGNIDRTFECTHASASSKTIYIFWSHAQSETHVRTNNAGNWTPNHFVPLICAPEYFENQNEKTQQNQERTHLTPTKSTIKNNLPTQVRIPEYNVDDKTEQHALTSSADSTTNKEIITTPVAKRRQISTQNDTNDETTTAENRRIQARERMAAKRAHASTEEKERQRELARQRSASRRAALTPEEVERERVHSHERYTARKAASTPEEIEEQRATTREKTATWRTAWSTEETEQHRVIAAERSMAKRATASPKEAEVERALARERSANRRAAYSPEELQKQRELALHRHHVRAKGVISKVNDIKWPRAIEQELKEACLSKFLQRMSMNTLEEGVCAICNARCNKRDLHHIPCSRIPSIELLKIHDDLMHVIPPKQQKLYFDFNDKYNWNDKINLALAADETEIQIDRPSTSNIRSFIYVNGVVFYKAGLHRSTDKGKRPIVYSNICTECRSSLTKEKVPKFSAANNVWMGDIPKQLQGLTIPEQRLIALYRHNSCILKLHSSFHSASTAQSAIKGNCISFPQDVANIATTLPLELDDLCDSLKIIFVGYNAPPRHQLKHILTVRRKRVSEALQWLSQNNPLYQSVTINNSTINRLPNDDIPDCLWATMEISTDVETAENERSNYTVNTLNNPPDVETTTAVPIVPSAVIDVNGTTISSDNITNYVIEKMKTQTEQKTLDMLSNNNDQQEKVYVIPRGNKPINEYSNPNLLLGIFPTLFPYGCGALEISSRPVYINFREHLRYLLSYADRRFEEHYSFIFVVFNILQRRTACYHAQLMISKPCFQKSAQLLESLNSEVLTTTLSNISKTSHSKITDERVNTLMKYLKVVSGHVMGSAHSRSALRVKIHSLCFHHGLPSLFVTINPADIHSPVALYFAGIDLNIDKVLPETLGTSYERAQIIATHPVATAKFFNCLIKSILKNIVLGGVLGPTKAYFGTVENQGRGSLHLHLLIWLSHELTPAQLKEKIQSQDFRENLLKYLEDVVKEDLDLFRDETTVESSSRNNNKSRMQEDESIITSEIPPACQSTPNPASSNFSENFRKDIERLVESCNIHKHSATCYKYSKGTSDGPKSCRMRMPRALVKTSHIDPSTGQITMRRSHPWINNFNEWLITACRSNMDIKFIWSGNDAKALVYYITDYVTKSTLAFYDMFALAQQGVKSFEQQQLANAFDNALEKSRKLVLRCYNLIASQQEVSGVQVASYLMNFGDHYTTHTFRNVFLASIENYLEAELKKVRFSNKDIEQEELDEVITSLYDEQSEDTKVAEEQFILEPTRTENGDRYVMVNTRIDYQHRSKYLTDICLYDFVSYYQKKAVDKLDRHLLKNASDVDGQRLNTDGTRMNERYTFARAHPQSLSHIIIKRTTPIVPALLGPQIPRREREETRERYCRALLTLFVPWRSVNDICVSDQTWSEALMARKERISQTSLKVIENIQLLHECKQDRDEHLHQVLLEAENEGNVDPMLISNVYEEDQNAEEDDPEELLQMLSIVNEGAVNTHLTLSTTLEQRYINDALQAIDSTDRFAVLKDHRNPSKQINNYTAQDFNTFVMADSHHLVLLKEWKRDIEVKRDNTRKYLISGENTLEIRDNDVQLEVAITEIPTSPLKAQTILVPPVIATTTVSLPTKMDIIKKFTLNSQQKYAFMIVAGHLDGDYQSNTATDDNQLLMCIPGCGGTGKSQLIRSITEYFHITKRARMLRKLAPTSIAAAEIGGLTIHSFLGESRKYSRKRPTRNFKPGDMKLEEEWRYVKYLMIDEMSMVGLSLLARLNRIVKTAKHVSSDAPFGGVSLILFGDYLQYSPVLDRPLYQNCAPTQQLTERQIDMLCAQKIISQINCVVELTQQMRTDDTRYLQLLERLRNGQSTVEDYQLLCTRVIGTQRFQTTLKYKPWNEAPILVFRNALRTQINNRAVINRAIEMKATPIVCIAQDYILGKPIQDLQLRKAILELSDNKTEHLPGYLPLVSGMPVLLTENVATELGLSNGTRGIFRQLVYEDISPDVPCDKTKFPDNTKYIAAPKYALVEFPNCKLDSEFVELPPKIVPIFVSEQTFQFDMKEFLTEKIMKTAKLTKRTAKISVKRKALPLIPAYSMTTHKSQGQTLNNVIIDLVMPPGPIELASVYVPLSRVKKLQDLLILRPFEFATLQIKPSKAQLDELKRLEKIAQATRNHFQFLI